MAESRRWIVTATDDRPVDDVVKDLTEAGFAVDQVLEEIGCVTGEATDAVAERLRSVPGVGDVSPEGGFDIGPPDAPVTW